MKSTSLWIMNPYHGIDNVYEADISKKAYLFQFSPAYMLLDFK